MSLHGEIGTGKDREESQKEQERRTRTVKADAQHCEHRLHGGSVRRYGRRVHLPAALRYLRVRAAYACGVPAVLGGDAHKGSIY